MPPRDNPLRDFIAAMANDEEEGPRPLEEAVVGELQAVFRAYRQAVATCRFRPGDLVSPCRGRGVRGVGEPHIVLEIFDPPLRRENARPGTSHEFFRIDMRVACLMGEDYLAFAAESWMYEPWQPKSGEQTDAA